jgi:adenylyltransferase/sulfurtransferase
MEWRTVRFKKDSACAVCGPTAAGQAPGCLPQPDEDRESASAACRLA